MRPPPERGDGVTDHEIVAPRRRDRLFEPELRPRFVSRREFVAFE